LRANGKHGSRPEPLDSGALVQCHQQVLLLLWWPVRRFQEEKKTWDWILDEKKEILEKNEDFRQKKNIFDAKKRYSRRKTKKDFRFENEKILGAKNLTKQDIFE
jgi:hypothetical protein